MAYLKVIIVAAVALALVAPAAAEWSAFGSIEPSTPYDDAWLFSDPALVGEAKIYFNAISGTHYPPASAFGKPWINPNVALLGTNNEAFGLEYHNAWLGVWTDCNGDGYVGAAESGVREYSGELLSTDEMCPAVEGPAGTWPAGANQYNGWVSEFIPIVNGVNLSQDARVYRDDAARVWGDFDRPDEHPTYRTCPAFPWPRGTYESTGGVLNYVDCRIDLLEGWNNAVGLVGDPAGLGFDNDDDARSGLLGEFYLGGPENDEHSAATVWDCDAEYAFHSGDFGNSTGQTLPTQYPRNIGVYSVDPQPGNVQDASVAGTLNHTFEGFQFLQSVFAGDEQWNCDTSDDFGHDLYDVLGTGAPETDFNGVDPNDKREANWNLGTQTVARGALVAAGIRVAEFPVQGGASGMPGDAAIGPGGTRWVGDSTWGTKPGPRTIKVDLATGQVGIADAYWLSFYAQLGPTTLGRGFALKSATTGEYGSWACSGVETGIVQGWNCDGSLWYQNPDGSFPNNKAQLAHPGWTYHIRDVDCYDGHVRSLGVGITPAFYGENPCP